MDGTVDESVIIIGSGPAGLTAALYAARASLAPLVFEGPQPGGQLMTTNVVENWPGTEQIKGPELMRMMRTHAQTAGARILRATITRLDLTSPQSTPATRFTVHTKTESFTAQALIIATGATSRRLQCPGESEYWSKGVSSCATCDGPLYANKQILIIGGGDTALENALFMAHISPSVVIVHITAELTGSMILRQRVAGHPHIRCVGNATVTAFAGNGTQVTTALVRSALDGSTLELPIDAAFVSIGLIPNNILFQEQLQLTPSGHLVCTRDTQTSIQGVFAAGDIVDCKYRQAISSAGSGCMAALDVERYLHTRS